MADEKKRSLVGKLAAVMGAVERIPKRGRNLHFQYDYVREGDLVDAIRTELANQKVFVTCEVESIERVAGGTTQRGAEKIRTYVSMVFTFHDADSDERIRVPFQNESVDQDDKGTNKAITAAKKYFLLTNFLVPTGDDLEQEGPKEEHKRPTTNPPSNPPAASTHPPGATTSRPSPPNAGVSAASPPSSTTSSPAAPAAKESPRPPSSSSAAAKTESSTPKPSPSPQVKPHVIQPAAATPTANVGPTSDRGAAAANSRVPAAAPAPPARAPIEPSSPKPAATASRPPASGSRTIQTCEICSAQVTPAQAERTLTSGSMVLCPKDERELQERARK